MGNSSLKERFTSIFDLFSRTPARALQQDLYKKEVGTCRVGEGSASAHPEPQSPLLLWS